MGRRLFTITYITRITVELVDISQVPRELLKIDHAAIQAAIDAGERDIPGVTIFNPYLALYQWYAQRVADLQAAGERSTRAEDERAAQRYTSDWERTRREEIRDMVRALRRALAPSSWKRKGRPRK